MLDCRVTIINLTSTYERWRLNESISRDNPHKKESKSRGT
ncbi:hypothetical protein BVRB_5g107050 [Beta vulgaris subsp. vulgaris]|nr:hypothetical protein BVRB_5g107050 [Beta vulgaris subsp. vulgaris]